MRELALPLLSPFPNPLPDREEGKLGVPMKHRLLLALAIAFLILPVAARAQDQRPPTQSPRSP